MGNRSGQASNMTKNIYRTTPAPAIKPTSLVGKHAGNGKSKRKKKRGKR